MESSNDGLDDQRSSFPDLRSNLSLDLGMGLKRIRNTTFVPVVGSLKTPIVVLDSPDVKKCRLELDTPDVVKFVGEVDMTPTPSLAPSNPMLPIYGACNVGETGSEAGNGRGGSLGKEIAGNNNNSADSSLATAEQIEFSKGFDLAMQELRNKDNRIEMSRPVINEQLSHQQQSAIIDHAPSQAASFAAPVTIDSAATGNQHQHYEGQKAEYGQRSNGGTEYSLTQMQSSNGDHLSNYREASLPSYGASVQIKSEPNDINCTTGQLNHHLSSPPMSPIDMADQERIKLERKRLRNRIAATKCRKNKLEKISQLEGKVKELRDENSELLKKVNMNREYVSHLKQVILDHAQHGCHIESNYV
ncbi:Transcription factor AP-1 [Halotydeus destructor]|nr:Transcription factor AP-1 [Halotydeus destructor]